MAGPVVPRHRPRPPLYRLARALRLASLAVLIAIILFVATVAYSAYEVVRSGPSAGSVSAQFAPNDTVAVLGQFTFSNVGIYPVNGFSLHLLVRNGTGEYLGESTSGPVNFAPGASQQFPFAFYLPVTGFGAASSLLTLDQNLAVGVWANATFGYVFPISVALTTNKSWGAPFAEFRASVGSPFTVGGTVEVPVTIQFQNHASFTEGGTLAISVVSSSGPTCGGGSFPLNVAPGQPYSQTNNLALASGCAASGGTLETQYVTTGGPTLSLPSEPIP